MTLDHSRMGTFMIEFETIEQTSKDTWAALMSDLVIVDAEVDFRRKSMIYTAISDRFVELTDVSEVLRYKPEWNDAEGRFVWLR